MKLQKDGEYEEYYETIERCQKWQKTNETIVPMHGAHHILDERVQESKKNIEWKVNEKLRSTGRR